jgi:hypothetical protein
VSSFLALWNNASILSVTGWTASPTKIKTATSSILYTFLWFLVHRNIDGFLLHYIVQTDAGITHCAQAAISLQLRSSLTREPGQLYSVGSRQYFPVISWGIDEPLQGSVSMLCLVCELLAELY